MKMQWMAVVALAGLPALVAAQATGTRGGMRASNYGLDRSQVMQLQQALKEAGCDAGPADGVVGPKTRSAVACARQQKGISGNDMNALYSALNLNFENAGATGASGAAGADSSRMTGGAAQGAAGATVRDSASGQVSTEPAKAAVRGDSSQVGGGNEGRIRTPNDSTHAAGKTQTRPPKAAQEGGGMHDSTTSEMAHDSTMHHQKPTETRPPR
jgi:peptidoglycan hydrolase-like protein with peptidoglycan-binding domain